jgi:hypothetical protein
MTVFDVGEAYSKVTRHALEGDIVVANVFKFGEASSKVAQELENIEVAWHKAMAVRELTEGDRVMTVFEVGDASLRAPHGVLCLMISSTRERS